MQTFCQKCALWIVLPDDPEERNRFIYGHAQRHVLDGIEKNRVALDRLVFEQHPDLAALDGALDDWYA